MPGRESTPAGCVAVSAVTGEGLATLLERIAAARESDAPTGEDAIALNRRQAASSEAGADALDELRPRRRLVLVAEELRAARARSIGSPGAQGSKMSWTRCSGGSASASSCFT